MKKSKKQKISKKQPSLSLSQSISKQYQLSPTEFNQNLQQQSAELIANDHAADQRFNFFGQPEIQENSTSVFQTFKDSQENIFNIKENSQLIYNCELHQSFSKKESMPFSQQVNQQMKKINSLKPNQLQKKEDQVQLKGNDLKQKSTLYTHYIADCMNEPFQKLSQDIQVKELIYGPQQVFRPSQIFTKVITQRQFFYRLLKIKTSTKIWRKLYKILCEHLQALKNHAIQNQLQQKAKIIKFSDKISVYLQLIHEGKLQEAFAIKFGNEKVWKKEYSIYQLNLNREKAQKRRNNQNK